MKKSFSLAAGLAFLLFSFTIQAQTKTGADFFAGKWKTLVTGTPYGDLKRVYVLEKKDKGLTGVVQDWDGKEIAKCSRVEVKDDEVTLYYQSLGNDVVLVLKRTDDDHVAGKVLDMFDAKGERIK